MRIAAGSELRMDDRQAAFRPPPLHGSGQTAARAETLQAIFLAHHRLVYRTAHRITGNTMDAEDVLQTVFLRLLRRDSDPPASAELGRYLHVAAVNGALDLLRARKVGSGPALGEAELRLIQDAQPGPERINEDAEIRRKLRAALSKLGPLPAQIFCLRYFEGYANREIARMLGTSATFVAVVLHRARKRLRKEIRPLLSGGQT